MSVDGGKPAFQRAIPPGTVIFVSLLQVVIFGVSGGFLRAVSGVGPRSPFWDRFGGCWGAI